MQFVHEAEEYAKNLIKYGDLDEVVFSPSQSLEEVIGKLNFWRAIDTKKIMKNI